MKFQFPYWYICDVCQKAGFSNTTCYWCVFKEDGTAYILEQIEHSVNIAMLWYLRSLIHNQRCTVTKTELVHILTSGENAKHIAWNTYLQTNKNYWVFYLGYTILEIADIRTALAQLRIDLLNPRFPDNDDKYWGKRLEDINLLLQPDLV